METEHQVLRYRRIPLALIPLLLITVVFAATFSASFSDAFNLSESLGTSPRVSFSDKFSLTEFLSITNIINVVTITITSMVTQIAQNTNCTSGSCFFAPSGIDNLITTIVIPAIFLAITGFGVMYMGIKVFGVLVMMESFIFMGLAFLGIIPSWFTLLIILFVSAAMAKIVWGFFKGGSSAI